MIFEVYLSLETWYHLCLICAPVFFDMPERGPAILPYRVPYRSCAKDAQWLFLSQGTRKASYLSLQDFVKSPSKKDVSTTSDHRVGDRFTRFIKFDQFACRFA
ncbi:hypothetical protein RB195_024104 [Necator americanus]|uniref:Uncharacterized protein n=1 Tax=Necator americanus TaxID=51031 RepID=A0ABR1ELY6_NECAM